MDAEYLKSTVGNVLSSGLAEAVAVRPDDPVDFLAQARLPRTAHATSFKPSLHHHLSRALQYLLQSVADTAELKDLAGDLKAATAAAAAKKDADAVDKARTRTTTPARTSALLASPCP